MQRILYIFRIYTNCFCTLGHISVRTLADVLYLGYVLEYFSNVSPGDSLLGAFGCYFYTLCIIPSSLLSLRRTASSKCEAVVNLN